MLLISVLVSLLLSGAFVQLAKRNGWGKSIRQSGPNSHLSKEGTPTMGGIAFLSTAILLWLLQGQQGSDASALLLLTLGSALVGLLDDLTSLRRKRRSAAGEDASGGVLARYRLLLQALLALSFSLYATSNGHQLFGIEALDVLGFTFMIIGSINAINFSDGLDGLAAGMVAIMLLLFLGHGFAVTLLGSLLGFLWYNSQPARVFMGGVGSEGLGAALAGLAIISDLAWYLPLIALVPALEVISVILQVTYFRLSGGRRILRMSPLHHHFELSGWSEGQVVNRFWLITAVCVGLAYLLQGGFA